MRSLPLVVVLLLAGAVCLYGLGVFDQLGRTDDAALNRQTVNALHITHSWSLRNAAVQKAYKVSEAARVAALLRQRAEQAAADSLAVRVDSARVALARAITAQDSIAALREGWASADLEIGRLRAAIQAAVERAGEAEADRARWRILATAADSSLTAVKVALVAEMAARRCRMAFVLPCPSRPLAFALGAAGGLLGGLALRR